MRIVVNDIAATPLSGGGYQVLKDFYDEVLQYNNKNLEWIFLLSGNYFETNDKVRIIDMSKYKSWVKRMKFDLFNGKKIINELKADAYISLQNTATLGLSIPQVVYLHQIIPYQNEITFSFFKKEERKFAIYQRIIGKIFNLLFKYSKATVVVQTKAMKKLVKQKINNEIFTCYPDVKIDNKFKRKQRSSLSTFIYPASNHFYKNHRVIVEAAKLLLERGILNFEVIFTIKGQQINQANINQIGQLDKEKLIEKMSNSTLLFASSFESFGLPLEEARQLGIRIIAPNLPYAKEILDNYPNAFFFDIEKPYDLSLMMEQVISQKSYNLAKVKNKEENLLNLVLELLNG